MALNTLREAVKEETKAPVEATAEKQEQAVVSDNPNLGILSDKVAFVQPLGNPLRDDTTTVTVNGESVKKVTSFIVGYRFKALADITVPNCGTTDKFKGDYMDFDPDRINEEIQVKAGETFDLTPFEMALLASKEEYNKQFTGGDHPVTCAYSSKARKDQAVSGKVVVSELPRAVLRLATTQGSIKDFGIIDVCEKKMVAGPDGRETKVGVIKPGFEKWEPLTKKAQRQITRSAAGAGVKKATYDKNARNFLELVRNKHGYQK